MPPEDIFADEMLENNGWDKYQIYVVKELKRHNTVLDKVSKDIETLCINQAVDKSRLQMITAGISFAIAAATTYFMKYFGGD